MNIYKIETEENEFVRIYFLSLSCQRFASDLYNACIVGYLGARCPHCDSLAEVLNAVIASWFDTYSVLW